MATAKDIVNKMLETSDPDDPTQYLKGYRQQWYSLMRGGAHVDTFKTIEAALQRAKATRLCRGKEPVYIEQHELPDAPEGVFVSTEPTGIVYDVTKDYRAVQRGVTEAVDPDAPEPYLDWLGQKVDLGPLEKIRFGAHIHLSDEDMIRQNASESGIDVDSQAFWDEVERCMAIMESHCLQLLRESGLHVSDEGHDETGARVASVWIDTPDYERAVALVKAVINWAEGDWPSTTSGTMDYAFGADTQQRIYAMTEDAARFIDVTIEFTGTDALVEWSRLNLNEAITGDPDDPEVFLRSYVPRMLGRVMIEFNVIKPHFPDAPNNWIRENVNGMDLFRYNRVGEMKEVMRQMKDYNRQRGERAGIDQVTYRYRVPNPQGSSIVRQWLDKIGCPVPVIQWVCETNAPIWFWVSVKEFNAYMQMVYPQVKLDPVVEDVDDPDDPVAFLKRFKPAWKLLSHIKNGHFYFIDDAGRVAVADYSMRNQRDPGSADDGLLVLDKTKPLTRYRGIQGRKMWHIPVTQYYGGIGDKPIPSATGASEEEFADLWPKLEPLGFTQQIREEDEDIDPKAYLDATTGWIDTFLNAGMTPSAEDTHRGQFWKRYECHGFNYLVVVSSRVPRFMIVERNDALYGTNTFRRVFEYPDGDINGLVTEFTALDRLLTKAITSAFDGFPAFDEKVDQLYKQHKRRRQRWLSGKIKEGVDDPDLQHYLPHISPERCLHCNNDLTQAKQVERNYYNRDSRIALVLPGHYEAADSAFEPDLRLEPAVLERLTNCPTFEDKCANCGTDTSQPVRHEESLDDPSPTYLEGIHELADVAVKLDELGFGIHKASHWGRWIVLSGHLFQPYSYNPLPPDQRITPEEYRARVERVMAEFQITQFHLTLGTDSFKLAVPKVQFIDGETLDTVKDWVTKHPSKNQSDWLPEALDPDDPDDPSVNVDRHIEAMDIDAMMERLGFYKRLPSWKCADPNYCWYERTMRGLRVSVIRKSDDEPHLFNVTFSRLKIKEYPAGKFPEYEEVAGFTAHVGDLEAKLRQFICTGKLRLREGSDPDDPGLNIERFAKHVEQVEQDALESAINMAVHEFELRVEKRNITTAREADQLAAEIGNQYAEMAGYENGSDEYDWVVSAVNNKAGEMFPGQWEDYVPEDQRKVMTHVSPQSIIESTLPSDYPGKTWQQVFEHFDNTPYKQLDVLVRSIRLRGVQYPIKLDEHGGQKYVTNGHHRLWLAHRLKLETVPVANVPNPLLEAKLLERNGKLNEMGGAVNIWLSPKGQAILCHDHAEHAASEILKKPLKSWPGTYWEARGRVYQEMFRRGWMRIAIPHAQKKLMVDYRGKTTEAQWEWIYEKAGQDKLAITDDQENVIVDYREGAEDAVQEAAQTWANVYRLPGGFRMVRDDNTAQLQTRSGQQIGFMAWRGASPRVGVTDRTIEIEHLEVNERYQNRGLGEAMLRQLKALIPTLYPHARYVVAKTATSKGIIRLLRRVFGPELRTKGTEKLPKRSPADWIQTMNRGYALFRLSEGIPLEPDPDDIDPKAYAMALDVFDPTKIVEEMEALGWVSVGCSLAWPPQVWLLEWNSPKELTHDMPDVEYKAEADKAGREAVNLIHRLYPDVAKFEYYAPFSDGDFGLYFTVPAGKHPLKTRTWESKETVDYPAVYVQGRIFIGPSHFHIVSALEQLGIKLGGESHEEAHHGWWTSNSRFLDTDTDINELIKLDKRFAQSTESEPGVKGETLPKAKAMTGVREVHESIDLPPEDEPENVLPSAEKSLVTAELKRLDFGPKPERGVEWIYGEEMPRFWYNTYKGADGSNRAIYIYFVGGQTPEVQTRNYNAPAKAWFQRGKDAPPTAPAQSQAHLAAIIRDLDSAMRKSATDSLPVEQEFEAIERVIRHHRQWWEDTLDYLINTQGGTIPGRMGPGQPA